MPLIFIGIYEVNSITIIPILQKKKTGLKRRSKLPEITQVVTDSCNLNTDLSA